MREAVDGPAAERSPSLSAAMQQYEYIQNRRVFAMSLRDTMQRNYEQALFDAQVQHEYMQIHVHPSLPQSASVPRPLLWSAISFIALFVFWLTGLLLVASLRDHSV